ncbi:helix-turn-helix transcriptional regulator [Clostridium sp. D53t1_180928_C8]|uniref:helix-turn-helix domain-containing protein n=1 Tax=Clostridium sp. D53t1_180928_C8 TaxID=2787101 RepID=UPI0018AA87A3|nr:helix-turn-helix transcriptional regulator [Clostridium sp. D53t1_180928_C8]
MIGDTIKELRDEKDIKQKELALYLGVSPSTIGMYEQNRRTPDSEMILKLSDFFNVSTDYLLGKSTIRNPQQTDREIRKKEVETIAAHLEGKDITPKKMKLIKNYIDALFDDFDDE